MNWKIVLILGIVFFGEFLISCCNNFAKISDSLIVELESETLVSFNQGSEYVTNPDSILNNNFSLYLDLRFTDSSFNTREVSTGFSFIPSVYACDESSHYFELINKVSKLKIYSTDSFSSLYGPNSDISKNFYFYSKEGQFLDNLDSSQNKIIKELNSLSRYRRIYLSLNFKTDLMMVGKHQFKIITHFENGDSMISRTKEFYYKP